MLTVIVFNRTTGSMRNHENFVLAIFTEEIKVMRHNLFVTIISIMFAFISHTSRIKTLLILDYLSEH